MLCLPALRVEVAKVLEETVAAAEEIDLGVVAVVAAEARAFKVHLHQSGAAVHWQQRGFLSPVSASDEMLSLQSARPPAQRVHCDDNIEPEPQHQYSWPGQHCYGRTATSTAELCWSISLYVDHGTDVLIFFRWTAAPTAIYDMFSAVREV